MAMLPAYSLVLGLLALLGFMAMAAGVKTMPEFAPLQGIRRQLRRARVVPAVVPVLVCRRRLCGDRHRRAGAGGDHVDRRSQPVTRNIYREFINRKCTDPQETQIAKIVSLVVKVGALVFIFFCR